MTRDPVLFRERKPMAKLILLKCRECDQTNEIPCDGDNPLFCPDCQSVDSFDEPEDDDTGAA